MAERVEHPYECQAKGHQEGSRTFLAAPPEWFAAKGMSTPKNCKPCRNWIKEQADEMLACSCGSKIRLSARSKISHFKKVGPYEPVTECRSCREGKRPPKGMKRRPDKKKLDEQNKDERPTEFSALHHGVNPQARSLIIEGPYYTKPLPGRTENRLEHIGRHVPGSPYDQTAAANESERKSPSSFAVGDSVEGLLRTTREYLGITDDTYVREYEEKERNRVVRVTFSGDHERLEISILDQLPDGTYGLVTTYDNVTVSHVTSQPWYNRY